MCSARNTLLQPLGQRLCGVRSCQPAGRVYHIIIPLPTPPPCYSDSSFSGWALPAPSLQCSRKITPANQLSKQPHHHFLDIQALVGKNKRALGVCSLRLRVSRSQNTYPQAVWSERTSGSSLEAWAERVIWSAQTASQWTHGAWGLWPALFGLSHGFEGPLISRNGLGVWNGNGCLGQVWTTGPLHCC